MRGRRSVRAKRARCVCVCARPVITFSTWFLSFKKKKPNQTTNNQKKTTSKKQLKKSLEGARKRLRDAIRCCARAAECLTNSLHANEQRVQLETKYNRSNQIAYHRHPNKTLLLRRPFTRSRPFLCTVTYCAKRIPKLRPLRAQAGDCSHASHLEEALARREGAEGALCLLQES